MCVILHKLKENRPFSVKDIEDAMTTNPDGFSITKIYKDFYETYKTIDEKEFIKKYEEDFNNGTLDDIEYIIHCRIMTNGKVSKRNCHPFENENYVLWHNGIIGEFSSDKDKVDSEQFLNKYIVDKNMKTETIKKRFAKNSSSKFIVLKKDTMEIIQSDNFIIDTDTGNYMSNDNHKYSWYSNYYKSNKFYDYYDNYDNYNYWNDYGFDYIDDQERMIEYINKQRVENMTTKEMKEYIIKLEDYIYSFC